MKPRCAHWALWLLLLPLAALAQPSEVPLGEEQAELKADHLRYDRQARRLEAQGGVVLRTQQALLRADSLTYEEDTQRALARGNVSLVFAPYVAVAEAATVDVGAQEVVLQKALLMRKVGVSAEALRAAPDTAALLALGRSDLALRGEGIRKLGEDHFLVQGLAFTPCDCDLQNPSWRLQAREAEVRVGEEAWVRDWKVYVGEVPVVLAGLPVPLPINVPLTDRRSGLLFPTLTNVNATLGVGLPLFLTLGPSYDLTLTPRWFFGSREKVSPAAAALGPGLESVLRYFPVEGLQGEAGLNLLYDLLPRRALLSPNPATDEQAVRGLRGQLSFSHEQALGRGGRLAADVRLVSDSDYVRDFATDVQAAALGYVRSTLLASHATEDVHVGASAVLLQDLRPWGLRFLESNRTASGALLRLPSPVQRLPALTLSLPERPLAGALFWAADVDYAREGPLFGSDGPLAPSGDEGEDGVWSRNLSAPDTGQGNGLLDAGERERRHRLDVLPRLALPLGGLVRVTPTVGARLTATVGEVSGRAALRAYPLLGAAAETQVVGRFGALEHRLTPYLEARVVPAVWGSVVGDHDAFDRPFSLPDGAGTQPESLWQAVAELRQRLLWRPPGGTARELLRLDVGQGFDFAPAGPPGQPGRAPGEVLRLADTYGRLSGRLGPLSLAGQARMEPERLALSQLSALADLRLPWVGLSLAYDDLVGAGSDRLRRGLDALVGPARLDGDEKRRLQQARCLVRLPRLGVRGLDASVGALVLPQSSQARLGEGANLWEDTSELTVGVGWAPACDCFRLNLQTQWRRDATGTFQFNWNAGFAIAGFGNIGL